MVSAGILPKLRKHVANDSEYSSIIPALPKRAKNEILGRRKKKNRAYELFEARRNFFDKL